MIYGVIIGPKLRVFLDGPLQSCVSPTSHGYYSSGLEPDLPDYLLFIKIGAYLLEQCTQIHERIYCQMVEL